MTRSTNTLAGVLGAAALASLAAAPMTGCRGERTDATPHQFFPDMDEQERWNPQSATDFYADGQSGRMTPPNAVAFSAADFDPERYGDEAWAESYMAERASMLGDDDAVYLGTIVEDDGIESYVDTIPVRVTKEMIERGQHQYNIYCVACHGYTGDGQGMVGKKWYALPADLTKELYRDRANRQGKDGYLFHTALNGVLAPDGSNRMPGYKHALSEMDAWAVVAYIRTLQKARGSSWDDLTPEQQKQLGQPTPAADTAADTQADASAQDNGGES